MKARFVLSWLLALLLCSPAIAQIYPPPAPSGSSPYVPQIACFSIGIPSTALRGIITDNSSLDVSGDVTISAWIYRTGADEGNGSYIISKQLANIWSYALFTYNGQAYFRGNGEVSSGVSLPIGAWTYVTATLSGSTVTIYFNGTVASTGSQSASVPLVGTEVVFGNEDYDFGQPLVENVKEVSLWNVARTQPQILQDMLGGINPSASGLIGYWKCSGQGLLDTALIDSSTNGNNAALAGEYNCFAQAVQVPK